MDDRDDIINKLGPYSENTIIVGDCVDIMQELPDGCVDLVVTSPPYDDLRTYDGYVFDFEAIARGLWRITKEGGVVVWVVGDATIDGSETGTSFRQALYFMELGFNLHDTMIYEIANLQPRQNGARYEQGFEYMFVFSKGKPKTVHVCRVPTKNKGMRSPRWARDNNQDSLIYSVNVTKGTKYARNIWAYAVGGKNEHGADHPAPFPEALARDHILSWSNPDDLVFDPMIGSGTTAKMAKQTGRRWFGCDISEDYVAIARKRVAQAQPALFVEVEREGEDLPEQLGLV